MKKKLALILSLMMLFSTPALAEKTPGSALDAFYALTGQQTAAPAAKTSADYLADIMTGAYAASPDALAALSSITNKDIAAYASANATSVKQVRSAYYAAMTSTLQAEIAANPATGDAQNVQTILSLFLDQTNAADDATRAQIRQEMTPEAAASIAAAYGLPTSYISHLIMNGDWDDDDTDDLKLGDKDSKTSTRVADLQEKLIALGYLTGKADGIFGKKTQAALIQYQRANGLTDSGSYSATDATILRDASVVARWDYDDSFDNTPDNTPDNSPDRRDNSPDNTPDDTP